MSNISCKTNLNHNSYLSLDAFSSNTASLNDGPNNVLARHKILVVLPVPGGPYTNKYLNMLNIYISYKQKIISNNYINL